MSKVYAIITEKILKALDAGTVPWRKPWIGSGLPKNIVSKKEYRGINILLLGMLPYKSSWWLTPKQVQKMGGTVKTEEKKNSYPVIFWKWLEGKELDAKGNNKRIPFLRYYRVYNVTQCEGIDDPDAKQHDREHTPIEAADKLVAGFENKPEIQHKEQQAFYSHANDMVNMPVPESFESGEEYYTVLFHELVHSTGHKGRLDREGISGVGRDREKHSKEELIAEMGAAFLAGIAGISESTIDNSASYIAGWRKKISEEPKLVVQAAANAQKAVDHIQGKKWDNDTTKEKK